MSNVINRLKTWVHELKQDVKNTEHLADDSSIIGAKFDGAIKAQKKCAKEVDDILDKHECSCQEK